MLVAIKQLAALHLPQLAQFFLERLDFRPGVEAAVRLAFGKDLLDSRLPVFWQANGFKQRPDLLLDGTARRFASRLGSR
jgi:hypothetical protein